MGNPQQDELLRGLKLRFERHPQRHEGIVWPQVQDRLLFRPEALVSLRAMEVTGGEPDVVAMGQSSGTLTFCDCSQETPIGRRSLCFDRAALDARKANKPEGNAVDSARTMGITLLTEEQYRHLQTLGHFDMKTSSWIATPSDVRDLGGALFGDRRFGRVFIYHNGAESYYTARGFRGQLQV